MAAHRAVRSLHRGHVRVVAPKGHDNVVSAHHHVVRRVDLDPAGLAAAWTANVEELCRVALMEFDEAEKLALKRWASGGLLEAANRP